MCRVLEKSVSVGSLYLSATATRRPDGRWRAIGGRVCKGVTGWVWRERGERAHPGHRDHFSA